MATHSPDVRNEVNYRSTSTIRIKGDLTTLDENVVEIVEQTDSYLVTVEDEPIEIHGKAKCSECGKITDVTLVSNDGWD